ncbi:hypothetical protein N657DRAFT_641367 [Parathielavia appendiculata]|uniref:AB hydrolase-1 domain-containing protein n=1 Tax=Parathielavia appendiculata TaxID=2587402 RepID=A0AAN6U7N6_9PEZI|nr:hypothetical protein N657DRAFT_641367 [Parathielavia appendiculata]
MQKAPNPTPGPATLQVPDAAAGDRWPLGPPGASTSDPSSLSTLQWSSRDPRTSSTQSLTPSSDDEDNAGALQKRTLLVIYIHGFMGDKSSFRSFPAHVHALLKDLLAETHVIHTKIYPRYKTYKSIDVACDNFSKWLAPHESPTTDVVLVGHSMGGLLAAEVVLLPNQSPYNYSSPFRHRILGTISLDAPLLGLHPGVVVTGIASLFRPVLSPTSIKEDSRSEYVQAAQLQNLPPDPFIYSDMSASPADGALDPFFDPPFKNDVAYINRGWLKNALNFITKHKEENLAYAAAKHLFSHLEFGACLADYPELRSRYNRLRRLEDVDDVREPGAVRVRFVNYYTVSTGILRQTGPASPHVSQKHFDVPKESNRSSLQLDSPGLNPRQSAKGSRVSTPRISIEEYSDSHGIERLQILDPTPEPEPESEPPLASTESRPDTESTPPDGELASDNTTNQDLNLPSIPSVPTAPTPPDLDSYPDKESRKQAEKTFKVALKAHAQALKAREKAIKDQQRALDKQHREALKLEKKQAKLQKSPPPPPIPGREHHPLNEETREQENKKPPRRRKFCMLPPKSATTTGGSSGARDPTWIEVYMEGVDEVGAHCGLFVPDGPHYERLVGDVGERIAGWVWDDASRRLVLEDGLEKDGPGKGV